MTARTFHSDAGRGFCAVCLGVVLFVAALACPAQAGDCTVSPSPFWENVVDFPLDDFRHNGQESSELGWIKFAILTCDPTTVYFQDSIEYIFHYDFATAVLDPFIGMSPGEFDLVSLAAAGQQVILGTIIMPPIGGLPAPPNIPEYGIQFVRQDPYTPQEIVELFNVVKSSIIADPAVQAFYFPTFEQSQTAQDNIAFLEANGVLVSSTSRWAEGNVCYSKGWALGEIKFFTGDTIASAYLTGDLAPTDILLTDGVPAEIPFLAGVLSLAPSTPNSHVAILADTFDIPFAHLALADDADLAQQLLGNRIVLRAFGNNNDCDLRLLSIEGLLTEQQIEEILELKQPPELDIAPTASLGAFSGPVDSLMPADIQFFGGKATNFGILRRSIPDNSPLAGAFSFDLWSAFLDQTIAGGITLRQEIDSRLGGFTFPPNMADLAFELNIIQIMIRDDLITTFSPALQSAIISTLQDAQYGFNLFENIRFRSSTNVEDGDKFTGAGLYDSRSGCLADDLDGDAVGPSICDFEEPDERGVFRAIRRVFASFYNDNAYLERLRHGIAESDVGMAILVHHSFPDQFELANGVATVAPSPPGSTLVDLVTQDGAVSVTNPEDGAIPEEVRVVVAANGSLFPTFISPSNLVPLGAEVMDWPDDYTALTELLIAASDEFGLVTGLTDYVLDFEYKKLAPGGAALPAGGLVVKQIRQIPQPDDTPSITPFLINQPTDYVVYQGEFWGAALQSDVFAVHRLKSRLSLVTDNLWLTEANLLQSFYSDSAFENTNGCGIQSLSGPPGSFPGASYAYDNIFETTDGWQLSDPDNPRSYSLLSSNVRALVTPAESALVTMRDFGLLGQWLELNDTTRCLVLLVEYDNPVPDTNVGDGSPGSTTMDVVGLCPRVEVQPEHILVNRSFESETGPQQKLVTIDTSYYWPREPASFIFGFTSPVVEFVETTITGLTTDPIVLHGYYSQSYRPGHHNFTEQFLFEPRFEPGISLDTLAELEAQGVRLIHVIADTFNIPPIVEITLYADAGVGQSCSCVLLPYGDVDQNGEADADDLICMIDGLSGQNGCPGVSTDDLDVYPCDGGDGELNLRDLLNMLDALAGEPECPPPCN